MTPRSPARRRVAAVLVPTLLAAAVVVGVVVLSPDDDGRQTSPGASDADPGIAHVHGLGIDPADGSLMVATHTGLFRLAPEGGDAARVGDSYQDTMGFTVAGSNHFLGSGHPDLAGFEEGQPGLLGLIESTDGGESWQPVSLAGEADFHGLAVAGETTYGWDSTSGRLMATSDRRRWETRSTIDLFGFVVDPSSPSHLLGATPEGVTESTDGGRTWAVIEGPDLVALSWDAEAGLWGVDGEGQVWQQSASGWEAAGILAGEPHAFLAAPDGFYAATADEDGITTIFSSRDARQWDSLYRDGG